MVEVDKRMINIYDPLVQINIAPTQTGKLPNTKSCSD